jgi:hypothetical protein
LNQATVKEDIPQGTRALLLRNKYELWTEREDKAVAENDPVMTLALPRDLKAGEVVTFGVGIE